MNINIGMRNIKTGLAVLICVLISRLLKLEYPFYSAIAAVIAMQTSVEASFKAGKNRMLGTFVGAVIGYVFALIYPGNIILITLGVMAIIHICNLLNWKSAVSIACVVFLSIMLNDSGRDHLYYSVNRLLDTLVGIIVALIINRFIAPPKLEKAED
ncbi:MAG TPA: hypothetical protein DGK91_03030 [Clostridium sp.]|nr:hypothetical protein [Clostridium sp.]